MAKFRKLPVIDAVQITEPMTVETLEGTMSGNVGDWLITGVEGEQYFCKDGIFQKTYEPSHYSENIVSKDENGRLQFNANKAREEMLQEIDEALMESGFWQGGRLDTIKYIIEALSKWRSANRLFDTNEKVQEFHRYLENETKETFDSFNKAQIDSIKRSKERIIK